MTDNNFPLQIPLEIWQTFGIKAEGELIMIINLNNGKLRMFSTAKNCIVCENTISGQEIIMPCEGKLICDKCMDKIVKYGGK